VVRAHRDRVLATAYAAHPERFVNGRPHPADLPTAVWINPPVNKPTRQDARERQSPGRTTHSMAGFSRPHADRPPC
jgi:hypothetical protein